MKTIRIGVVDDHRLFREGIVGIISEWESRFEVIFEADNGVDLMNKLNEQEKNPHIIIMDSEMPLMNGAEATLRVKDEYPEVLVLALTMLDAQTDFIRLVKAGVDGFLNKNTSPEEVHDALNKLINFGHYFKGGQMDQMLRILRGNDAGFKEVESLTKTELEFIRLAVSEMTYKTIAVEMDVSEKTVDGYRSKVFEKLDVKTRVGMVIRAIKEGIVKL
ncbi:MAG: response regulator transcription factor [Cryomorphaceae bacterium]